MKDEGQQAKDMAFGGNGVGSIEITASAHARHDLIPSSLILHPSSFQAERDGASSVLVTNSATLFSWARLSSMWQMSFGLACCAIEMMSTAASHYDMMRFGVIPRPSPRQSDLIIISGTVTLKMASRIKMLYEQMADPKYVISMGNCSNCGGPYWEYGYHVLKGVDRVIPVDVYVPGCPPRPEALLEGLIRLQEKIRAQG